MNNIKVYICNICNKHYKTYQSLWNHNKKFHSNKYNNYIDNKKRDYKCSICNKKFTRKDSMKYHMKTFCFKNKNNDNDKIIKLEKANRDRFILPIDKNISFFINVIDNAVDIFKYLH